MPDDTLESLRFPIGRFQWVDSLSAEDRVRCLKDLEELPFKMREAVSGLDEKQLQTPYREGGWTLRQVVHHVPDSHLNGVVRCKLALTEDGPRIKGYDQARWAELADTRDTPIETSLALLDALHSRWVRLFRAMSDDDYARFFLHPEGDRRWRLDTTLALYSWHSRHHVAHITSTRQRLGW